MSPQTQLWLTKAEAAMRLGVSERTIDTWAKERRVSTRVEPRAGRRPATTVDPADIERIFSEQHRGAVLAPETALPAAPSTIATIDALRQFAEALQRPRAPKPWMTLDEAAEYSGLPKRLLSKMVRDADLMARRHAGKWYVATKGLGA